MPWLRSLNVDACQLILFDGEQAMYFFYGCKDAYIKIMKVAGLLLEYGISPRLPLFIHQKDVDKMPYLEDLFDKVDFARRAK